MVVAKFANTTRHGAIDGKTQTHNKEYFNLEVITSVGYRVKSQRGVQFRQWANQVLMIAESKPEEQDVMVKVVVNLINQKN